MLQKELNIRTFGDLIYYLPYRYVDRSKVYKINEINENMPTIQIVAKITRFVETGIGRQRRLNAIVTDETGTAELVWFKGVAWMAKWLQPNVNYLIFGKPTLFNHRINIAHPEIEVYNSNKLSVSPIQPQYNTTGNMKTSRITSKTLMEMQKTLYQKISNSIDEILPKNIIEQNKLMPLSEALANIHFPQNYQLLERAQQRLKFDELFFLQLDLLRVRGKRQIIANGHVFKVVGQAFNRFYNEKLPFSLTNAQKRVIKEIRRDFGSGKQMNRLLQGDVGSGKTLVALMSMLIAIDNGFQACLMAPTEVLANQHFSTISTMLNGLNLNIGLLTGSTPKTERIQLHSALLDGSLNILIGTHALLEDTVQFKNLGFVVIDEQQRFGVAQRARLWEKNPQPPHILVMTATPIPRTLAMTVYGDLDVSIIDEMPPGRKPVKTMHFTDAQRDLVFGMMRRQIQAGRQVYVVYPLIKESEKMENLKDLEDGYQAIVRAFPPPRYVTAVVHGQMTSENKDISMQQFARGIAHIMVATTVIEVGMDVPNATMMVIESAERFGLSQLHQLRGRVGRGADESYCILMSHNKLSNDSHKRLSAMVATNDGFRIAEMDMQLRGPGDIDGTMQSGIPFNLKLASLSNDARLMQYVRRIAQNIINDDPNLEKPNNVLLARHLDELSAKNDTNFSLIS